MEFINKKKIQAKGAYFQVSMGIHEKYGKSLCLGIIPKKNENNKIRPNYDEAKTVLCSFNQASKIANKLFLATFETMIRECGRGIGEFFSYKVGKTTIEFDMDEQKQEILMSFSNGDTKSIIFNADTAFVASDLIKSRLNELEVEDETVEEKESPEVKELKRLFNGILKNCSLLSKDAVQDMLETGRKNNPKLSDVEILKAIGKPFGVE